MTTTGVRARLRWIEMIETSERDNIPRKLYSEVSSTDTLEVQEVIDCASEEEVYYTLSKENKVELTSIGDVKYYGDFLEKVKIHEYARQGHHKSVFMTHPDHV